MICCVFGDQGWGSVCESKSTNQSLNTHTYAHPHTPIKSPKPQTQHKRHTTYTWARTDWGSPPCSPQMPKAGVPSGLGAARPLFTAVVMSAPTPSRSSVSKGSFSSTWVVWPVCVFNVGWGVCEREKGGRGLCVRVRVRVCGCVCEGVGW